MRELDLDLIGFEEGYVPNSIEDLEDIITDVYFEVASLFVENILELDDDDLAIKIGMDLCRSKNITEIEQIYKKYKK